MGLISWVRETASRMTVDNRVHVKRLDGDAARERKEVTLRYDNKGEIARGGMGSIRIVHDTELLRYTAMKVFDPVDGIKDDARYEVFVEEAQITGQLDHPNIVPVHDVGKDEDGTHYFTMKLVAGQTLADMVRDVAYDPSDAACIKRALGVLIKVCDALSFAHAKGVVHRDLKPENIMVGEYGEVYLMDWGVAKIIGLERSLPDEERVRLKRDVDENTEAPGSIVGTISYMAPEQARGDNDNIDFRTDVFGMGAILYEVLTQVPPYYAGDIGQTLLLAMEAKWRAPQELCGEDLPLPAALCAICEKALNSDPRERYQDVRELKIALEGFLSSGLLFPSKVVSQGEVIVAQGEGGDTAYIIQRGYCRVFKLIDDEQVAVADLKPGDVFGETSVFTGAKRTATVQALTDVVLQVVQKEVFEDDMGLSSSMGAFVTALASRFVATDKELRALQGQLASGVRPQPVELAETPEKKLQETSLSPLALVDAVAKIQALASGPDELGSLLIQALSRGVDALKEERKV